MAAVKSVAYKLTKPVSLYEVCCLINILYCCLCLSDADRVRTSSFWGKAPDPTGALPWTPLGTSGPKPSVPTLSPLAVLHRVCDRCGKKFVAAADITSNNLLRYNVP